MTVDNKQQLQFDSKNQMYQSGDWLLCLYDYKTYFVKNCHYQVTDFGDELNVVTQDEVCETVPLSELPTDLFKLMSSWEVFLMNFHGFKSIKSISINGIKL